MQEAAGIGAAREGMQAARRRQRLGFAALFQHAFAQQVLAGAGRFVGGGRRQDFALVALHRQCSQCGVTGDPPFLRHPAARLAGVAQLAGFCRDIQLIIHRRCRLDGDG
ncbi:hypothetical protein FQZ97_1022460 [compost metagenome]